MKVVASEGEVKTAITWEPLIPGIRSWKSAELGASLAQREAEFAIAMRVEKYIKRLKPNRRNKAEAFLSDANAKEIGKELIGMTNHVTQVYARCVVEMREEVKRRQALPGGIFAYNPEEEEVSK